MPAEPDIYLDQVSSCIIVSCHLDTSWKSYKIVLWQSSPGSLNTLRVETSVNIIEAPTWSRQEECVFVPTRVVYCSQCRQCEPCLRSCAGQESRSNEQQACCTVSLLLQVFTRTNAWLIQHEQVDIYIDNVKTTACDIYLYVVSQDVLRIYNGIYYQHFINNKSENCNPISNIDLWKVVTWLSKSISPMT